MLDRFGSFWVVVDRFGSFWGRCGSLWVVVDRCGSFWVVPRVSNYDGKLCLSARAGESFTNSNSPAFSFYVQVNILIFLAMHQHLNY